jgi:multiple sugar transport system ATP-binding protein
MISGSIRAGTSRGLVAAELSVEEVKKTYPPALPALQAVTFRVAAGQCLALVGPSGCGKTTLLRVIAGLEQPTSGRVRIDGQCVNDVPCHQRGVAMLAQRPALSLRLTARQNLRWEWTLRQSWWLLVGAKRKCDEELLRLARALDLENDLERPVQELSGGQQQRVALGRCLLRQAKLRLLDEPLGHLDAPLRTELRRQLRSFACESRVTTIHVTHDPEEAFNVGDHVAIMQRGGFVQMDEPARIRRFPASRFVSELVHQGRGGMNFVAGHISRNGIDVYFENAFGRWPVSKQTLLRLRELFYTDENSRAIQGKANIMMGMAAGEVWCGRELAGEDHVHFVLPVQQEEFSGAGNWLIAADARGRWIGRCASDERFRPGQIVMMGFSMARAFWFDNVTGRTLLAPT